MSSDLEPLQSKLRSLARSKPNSAGRALIEEGLGSKWEGTQALAIKTLGAWGDQWSMEKLKQFLLEKARDPIEGSLLNIILEALKPNLKPQDRGWIVEYCKQRSNDRYAHLWKRLSDHAAKLR